METDQVEKVSAAPADVEERPEEQGDRPELSWQKLNTAMLAEAQSFKSAVIVISESGAVAPGFQLALRAPNGVTATPFLVMSPSLMATFIEALQKGLAMATEDPAAMKALAQSAVAETPSEVAPAPEAPVAPPARPMSGPLRHAYRH